MYVLQIITENSLSMEGATKKNNYLVSKTLKSLQIIVMPAGEAGIIDVEIKVNYFYSLLINTVNSVLTVRSILVNI